MELLRLSAMYYNIEFLVGQVGNLPPVGNRRSLDAPKCSSDSSTT